MFRFTAPFLAIVLFAGVGYAQDPDASLAQDLTSCAGVIASLGNLDPRTHPRGASGEWAPVLTAVLERLNREEGVEGMTGREAARAAQHDWATQPRERREAAARECRTRFGG